MRLAILSDVHSNLPALEAVLGEIGDADVEATWCLGDVVGYGADPDGCAALVAERCSLSLIGNHDLAVLGKLDIDSFSPAAAAAVEWTRSQTDESTLEFLGRLQPSDESHEVAIYHASPREPVWEYVLWPDQAAECLAAQSRRVSLVGHSHVALYFTSPDAGADEPEAGEPPAPSEIETPGGLRSAQAPPGTKLELGSGRWLLNPGSAGQPRDGDPRAAWLELDTETWEATYHRVEYDIERAANAITEAGLPEQLGKRLYVGQ